MLKKDKGYRQAALLEEVARNLYKVPFPLQRKLPILGWFLVIGNTILLFYLTIYPGWKIADQSGNAANTKGTWLKRINLIQILNLKIFRFIVLFSSKIRDDVIRRTLEQMHEAKSNAFSMRFLSEINPWYSNKSCRHEKSHVPRPCLQVCPIFFLDFTFLAVFLFIPRFFLSIVSTCRESAVTENQSSAFSLRHFNFLPAFWPPSWPAFLHRKLRSITNTTSIPIRDLSTRSDRMSLLASLLLFFFG